MTYRIGTTVIGKVTGIQPYGAFVSLDTKHQGLVHVSEVKHGFIKNIMEELEIGQEIKVKVIDIDEYTQKISLSIRALQEAPAPIQRKKKYFTNRHKKIGFKSIDERLEGWIHESLEESMEKH